MSTTSASGCYLNVRDWSKSIVGMGGPEQRRGGS